MKSERDHTRVALLSESTFASRAAKSEGTLFVVATPIGNLADMSPRAIQTLCEVDIIAAEDTRHSRRLMHHFAIRTPLVSLHEHNEREVVAEIVHRLAAGQSVALISDAGTPLISDPGYHLVRRVHEHGLSIVPVPGPSALLSALSVAGLPTDRFVFEGFLPGKAQARRGRLEGLKEERRTLVFFESPHRIVQTLRDMVLAFGSDREAALARELTKRFETVYLDTLAGISAWLQQDKHRQRGEFVLVIRGAAEHRESVAIREGERVLKILLEELPARQASTLAARITGIGKNELYQKAIQLKNGRPT